MVRVGEDEYGQMSMHVTNNAYTTGGTFNVRVQFVEDGIVIETHTFSADLQPAFRTTNEEKSLKGIGLGPVAYKRGLQVITRYWLSNAYD